MLGNLLNSYLPVAQAVLADAVAQAEFTQDGKDVQYVGIVARAVEKQRAKIENRSPFTIEISLVSGRIMQQVSLKPMFGSPKGGSQ